MKLEQQLYGISDLENMSASCLYSISSGPLDLPSHQLRSPSLISPKSFPTFSRYESSYSGSYENPLGEFDKMMLEVNKRVAERQRERWEEERKQQQEELDRNLRESIIHRSFEGSSWSKSFGLSTDYIKEIPQGSLHIHAPLGFITGAKLVSEDGEEKLSNYEAAMLDLQNGIIHKDNKKW